MPGPLYGLRVVEMAGLGPCPLAGQLLADMGAEVIVIDRRSDERMELGGGVNRRGKQSVAVNLKDEAGREVVLRLAGRADVLIEGFRPGVMERLGLGPDVCAARNPGLVFGRMTGWGQEGPLSSAAGHDLNYLSLTGALHAMGDKDRPPTPPLNLVADYGGGTMFLVTGVLAALFERSRSGRGQVVDAAMVDGVPALMGIMHGMLAKGNWKNERSANMLDGGAPFYRCYACADGKFVSVGALEPQFFEIVAEKLDIDKSWLSARMDKSRWGELTAIMTDIFAGRTRDEWAALFEGSDACVAPVLDWDEAPSHPHMAARGVFVKPGGVMQAAPAPRFSRTASAMPEQPHAAGADTGAVLAELGYSDAEIENMREGGALT
ncbi:MAG: CoA transferase [Nitratireductor sp.]|nr:CoA transferase [Nitratireductor sp.]